MDIDESAVIKFNESLEKLKADMQKKFSDDGDRLAHEYQKGLGELNAKYDHIAATVEDLNKCMTTPKERTSEELHDTNPDPVRKAMAQVEAAFLRHRVQIMKEQGQPGGRIKEVEERTCHTKEITTAYSVATVQTGGIIPFPVSIMPVFEKIYREVGTISGNCMHVPSGIGGVSEPYYEDTTQPTPSFDIEKFANSSVLPIKFGLRKIGTRRHAEKFPVTWETLMMPGFDILGRLFSVYRRSFPIYWDVLYWEGNGTDMPLGLKNSGLSTVANGHATNLSAIAIRKFITNLKPPYWAGAKFYMNKLTLGEIMGFVETGTDAFRNMVTKSPGENFFRVDGIPTQIDPNVPDIGSGTIPIWLGDATEAFVALDVSEGAQTVIDQLTQKDNFCNEYMIVQYGGGGPRVIEAMKGLKMEV